MIISAGTLVAQRKMFSVLVVLWILLPVTKSASGEGINITAVIKMEVQLPCDISSPSPNDNAQVVVWYKNHSGNAFYSVDFRCLAGCPTVPHIADEDIKKRMVFQPKEDSSYLLIQEVELSDEGPYRCRVDFRSSPTRNSLVNLTVIVPPLPPAIMDEKGLELSQKVGPYNEGSHLFLSCEAREGKPPPKVTWWRETTLLDDSYEVTSLGIVRNDLHIKSLTRNDFEGSFTCQASNTNLTAPVATAVIVDMNLKPLEVMIRETRRSLSAGKKYELLCRSTGSRPLPIMAWWKGNKRMKRTEETTSPDGNVTTSILTFTPTADDNGKYLSCRAENAAIPKSGIEDGWKLDIYFVPIVTLELGSSLKDDNIKEGDDVYFECNIRSNPWVHEVEWKFQEKPLLANHTAGIIVSNQSLVIQKVRKEYVGRYTCLGINNEGVGESNEINLQIKHPPICKPNQQTEYGIARNEQARITCEVEAYPPKVTFRWAFNGTSDGVDNNRERSVESTRSVLVYKPRSEKDYGTLYCWGTNEMGTQAVPCVFSVVAAGPPDSVHNCSAYNQTETSFYVECQPGYDGGLTQSFTIEVLDMETQDLKTSMTRPKPLFYVSGLDHSRRFEVSVLASNSKGHSDAVKFPTHTLRAVNTANDADEFSMTPILGVLIGVVTALAIVAIAIVVIMRCRATSSAKRHDYEEEQTDRATIPLRKDTDDGGDNEEKSPDVIPSSNGKEAPTYMSFPFATIDQEFPPVEVKCLQKQSYGPDRSTTDLYRPPTSNSYLAGPDQPNHTGTWGGTRKVKPQYEDVTYLEMQTPSKQRKSTLSRRPTDPKLYDPGETMRRNPRQFPDEEETPSADTPLMMNSLQDTMVSV